MAYRNLAAGITPMPVYLPLGIIQYSIIDVIRLAVISSSTFYAWNVRAGLPSSDIYIFLCSLSIIYIRVRSGILVLCVGTQEHSAGVYAQPVDTR